MELLCKTLQVEHKLFYFDLKENPRGRYLKISEKTSATRSTIIVPSNGIAWFLDLFNYYVNSDDQDVFSKELQLDTKARQPTIPFPIPFFCVYFIPFFKFSFPCRFFILMLGRTEGAAFSRLVAPLCSFVRHLSHQLLLLIFFFMDFYRLVAGFFGLDIFIRFFYNLLYQ